MWTAGDQKQLLNKWATNTKIYSGDTTTVMGAGKQNRNRHV